MAGAIFTQLHALAYHVLMNGSPDWLATQAVKVCCGSSNVDSQRGVDTITFKQLAGTGKATRSTPPFMYSSSAHANNTFVNAALLLLGASHSCGCC